MSLRGQKPSLKFKKRLFKEETLKTPKCWIWTGRIDRYGYGYFAGTKTSNCSAARFAMEMKLNRKLEKGELVCHTCDNPPCVRPSHLFIGTRLINNQDRHKKGRTVIKLGEEHGASIMNETWVRWIREHTEFTQLELGKRFNCHPTTICQIRKRHTWKHVL